MSNKKVLLLGFSGFLGSKLLEQAPNNIELWLSRRRQKISNYQKQVKVDLLDLDYLQKNLKKIRPQIIIHSARIHPFDKNPVKAKKITHKLTEIIKSVGAKLIYVSSDAVFDGKNGKYRERDKTNPITDYGKAKLAAENEIIKNLDNYIIVRPSYIYDNHINSLDAREYQLLNQIKNGKTAYLFKDAYRSPTLVSALAKAVWKLSATNFVGIIHLAGKRKSIYQFERTFVKKLGLNYKLIKPKTIKEGNQNIAPDTSLNTDLAAELIDFKFV